MARSFLNLLIFATLLGGCASNGQQIDRTVRIQTGINGQVTDAGGQAVDNVWVYAYRNTSTSLRGPADFAARTDSEGEYLLDLVTGQYYLIARWRRDGDDAGPPQTGDAWALQDNNPVRVKSDQLSRADFTLQGVQAGQPILLRSGSISQGKTGFTGRLIDETGGPLPGAFALAYSDTDFRRMPDYTSAVVGSDGRFLLYLPGGKPYCLAARTRTRGQPIAGEPYGLLGEGPAGCLTAIDNRLIDIGIIHLSPYKR